MTNTTHLCNPGIYNSIGVNYFIFIGVYGNNYFMVNKEVEFVKDIRFNFEDNWQIDLEYLNGENGKLESRLLVRDIGNGIEYIYEDIGIAGIRTHFGKLDELVALISTMRMTDDCDSLFRSTISSFHELENEYLKEPGYFNKLIMKEFKENDYFMLPYLRVIFGGEMRRNLIEEYLTENRLTGVTQIVYDFYNESSDISFEDTLKLVKEIYEKYYTELNEEVEYRMLQDLNDAIWNVTFKDEELKNKLENGLISIFQIFRVIYLEWFEGLDINYKGIQDWLVKRILNNVFADYLLNDISNPIHYVSDYIITKVKEEKKIV